MKASHFSPDIHEFLVLLEKYEVKYLIVGGEAVIYYGVVRLTGDVDFFYDNSKSNVERMYEALYEFWSGKIPEIDNAEELEKSGLILQYGVPPNRIDLVNNIDGVDFSEAWKNKKSEKIEIEGKNISVHFIGLKELITNKEVIRRNRDLEDLKILKKITK